MNEVDQTIAKVRTEAQQQGLRPATLARRSGLALNTLRDMYSPDWNPRVETLRKVLQALGSESESAA